ncbi:MAG: hypothetical protein EKK40_03275 [Bradyrhizobiaceae bacterium]|nr:MAG: hypothetical protein EKK40_03275 [Bradyrhizobiaceae bacterium]
MVQISSGVLGAAAAALAFGAVHLEVAAGNDLLGPRNLVSSEQSFQDASSRAYDDTAASVNRAAKADRESAPAAEHAGVTMSFRLANVPATSIVTRVQAPAASGSALRIDNPQAKNIPPHSGSRIVACEPSVSVLTPVARQLQPSRCVT